MKWSWKSRIWLLLGAAVLLLIVLVKLSGRQPVARISAVRAVRENLDATISSNGKVEPIMPYPLRAKLATFVQKIYAVEGQPVKRGQLLLTLDADAARADLARAREQLVAAEEALRAAKAGGPPEELARLESDLRKTEAERVRLQRDREALEKLVAEQAATPDELAQNRLALERAEADWQRLQKTRTELARRAKLDVERATLQVQRSKDEIRVLEENVRSAEVTSPVDGALYSLPVHAHDFMKVGDLLAEVADLRRVRVRAFIDEPDLGGLEPDQKVEISWDALPARVWYGRTEQVPKQVVARGTRSVGEVLCSVDNSKLELIPNINVNVLVHLRERKNALVVPRGAVQIEGSRRFVYVVTDAGLRSRLQKREIKVGIASATSYEVVDGLGEGEMVALPGAVDLRDGLGVRVVQME